MKPSVTRSYLDGLFANRDYEGLVWLSSMICGSSGFDLQHPSYGLSRSLFLFVESLFWFAQSSRSGVWTYFEATPATRQQNMLEALRELGPTGFDEQYGIGMGEWTNVEQAAGVDKWLWENEHTNNAFLWQLAEQNRAAMDVLVRHGR